MAWNEGGLLSGEVEPAGREPGVGLALPGRDFEPALDGRALAGAEKQAES